MSFNLDQTKPAYEVFFCGKANKTHHPLLMVNNSLVKCVPSYKYLGLILDPKLYFNEDLNSVLSKFNKMIALLRGFQNILPRHSVLTIIRIL